MTAPAENHDRALSALRESRASVELGTLDLCYLAALHLEARRAGLITFGEEQLVAIFERVCLAVEPETEQVRARGGHAIRRLRDQRMLARVDGAGVARAGEFALSRLGAAIVEFFLEEEVLTRQSLTLLTQTLLRSLQDVQLAAERASSPEDWDRGVIGPLRVTIADLTDGIERRQRGLDRQQEEFQSQIGRLLGADWFGALERCQSLLDSTAETLTELGEVLLRESQAMQLVLHDVLERAISSGSSEAEAATQRLMEQLDRIAAWGGARQQAWSEYYGYVHRYLRDVVRLDPSRALSQRLRAQLKGFESQEFFAVVAAAGPLSVLRPAELPGKGPPVRRPRKVRDTLPESAEEHDVLAEIESQVRDRLQQGDVDLSGLTATLTQGLGEGERFVLAGRIAQIVAKLTRPLAAIEPPWVLAGDNLSIEEWRWASRGVSE